MEHLYGTVTYLLFTTISYDIINKLFDKSRCQYVSLSLSNKKVYFISLPERPAAELTEILAVATVKFFSSQSLKSGYGLERSTMERALIRISLLSILYIYSTSYAGGQINTANLVPHNDLCIANNHQ